MRLLDVIQRSTTYLEERGVPSPRLQVELLLSHFLKLPRLQLYLEFERVLGPEILDPLREAVRRRGRREPLQHIIGSTSFCGLEIEVSPDALVPRPETELLAERAWTWLQDHPGTPDRPPSVLDWGTGTACIAIAVATHAPAARITAIDISPAALELARRNVDRHQCADRIRLQLADGAAALDPEVRFDLVVSNPPYIPASEIETLDPEVRDHDPRAALDGGPDGLDAYRRLASELPARLHPGGALLVEFGDGQASAVSGILTAAGWFVPEIHRDYSGRERLLLATREP